MRCNMGLVQRRGVKNNVHTLETPFDVGSICDRANAVGEGRRNDIETDDVFAPCLERADQGFAEMSGAAGDQYVHRE